MIITDLSQTTPLNNAIDLRKIVGQQGPLQCLSILTTGTFTGTPKLTISQDGTNFYPLYDEDGEQIALEANKIIFINYANLFLKIDLTDVSSEDLKVSIQ